ncbi:hypothetical protein ACROYT_G006362 [Oculina patagonica]
MKLWVGILFLVVSSQLGINARPIARPIAADHRYVNDQQDVYGENSLETQPKEQEDHNDEHSATDHGGEEEDHNDEHSATDHGGEEEDHNQEDHNDEHGWEGEDHNHEHSGTDHGWEGEDRNHEHSGTDHGWEGEDRNHEHSGTDHGWEGEDRNHEHSGTDHGWEGEDHNHEHSGTDHGWEGEDHNHEHSGTDHGWEGEDHNHEHSGTDHGWEGEDHNHEHSGTDHGWEGEDHNHEHSGTDHGWEGEDHNHEHSGTDYGGEEIESMGHLYGSIKNGRGIGEDNEYIHGEFPFEYSPFHYQPTFTDTTHQEGIKAKHFFPSREKHLGTVDKRADDNIMDEVDANNANFLETQREEEEEYIDNNNETEREEGESASIGKYGSVRNGRGVVEEDEDANDYFSVKHSSHHFGSMYTDTIHREDEIHQGTGDKRIDDTVDDNPDVDNKHSLETQTEEQGNIELNSESGHSGGVFESTGHYRGSAKEARGVTEEDEDVHDEFPFERSSFHFRPIYTDTAYHEDVAPKHFVPLHEKHLGVDNKKVDVDVMDQKPDAYETYSLEAPTEEQVNTKHNSKTEQNGDVFESTGYYHGSAKEARGIVEDDEDTAPKNFIPLHEKHHGTDNKKVDVDIMDQKPNAYATNALESPTENQVNIEYNSETEQNGDVFESAGQYHGSANEAHGIAEDEFPFEDSPFHFRPIYTDTAYQEDTLPKHFVPLHEKPHGANNKKVDDDIMDRKPNAYETYSLEAPTEEQVNTKHNSKTEQNGDVFESTGHYHGSAKEARGIVEDDEDTAPKNFIPLHEKHHGTDNKKVDVDIMDQKPNAYATNSLESPIENQVNIEYNSETEQNGDVFESAGQYHGSANEAHGIAEDEFPFEDSSFHFRPIYTDTVYQEDTSPKNFVSSHEKNLGTDNKKVDDDIMDQKPDEYETYSLESPTEKQVNIEHNSETEQNGDIFESAGHYHGSANEAQGIVEDEFPFEDSPFHFRPIYTDTAYQEDTSPKYSVSSHEKNLGTDNKKVDNDIKDSNPDAYNANSLEAQAEEQEDNIHNPSEAKENGVESESFGHYGSVRNGRGMVKDGEDVYDDFPFKDSPYYFRPIHTDNTYLKDKAPEHFVPLHEQDHGMDKKETGTSADGNVGFHSQRRDSRKSNKNSYPKTETTYRETKTPEESKKEFDEEGRVLFEDIDSFGNTNNDVIGLATMYRVTESKVSQEEDRELSNKDMAAKHVENGVHDESTAFKPDHVVDNGKDLVSHDEDNLQGDSEALEHDKENEGYYQASGADRKKNKASEWDEDDESDFLTSGKTGSGRGLHFRER